MRTLSRTAAAASVAAFLLGLSTVGSNAQWAHGGQGGRGGGPAMHGPGPRPDVGFHGHDHGGLGWGPAVGAGIGGGLAAGAIAGSWAAQNSCYQPEPIYDAYGNFVGNQTVYVCN
jgi:hypothetical protein